MKYDDADMRTMARLARLSDRMDVHDLVCGLLSLSKRYRDLAIRLGNEGPSPRTNTSMANIERKIRRICVEINADFQVHFDGDTRGHVVSLTLPKDKDGNCQSNGMDSRRWVLY